MTTRFFVYGSMTEGLVHWSKISSFVENKAPARVKASVWCLKVGYPVLIAEGADSVPGLLVDVKSSDLLVGLLDEFHGFNRLDPERSLYLRQQIEAIPEGGGSAISAWVYFLNPRKLPASAQAVPGGDWRAFMAQRPSLVDQLTERQRTYLSRLASATGREIVPINDMSLYRELMNLELIVDKGRRLALSKFGQEVARFLD